MKMKEKDKPPGPAQLDVARLLESIEIEDWIKGSEVAARYVLDVAREHDTHLREILERLALLENDVAELATESWPLTLLEVEADLERCLAGWPMSFFGWSFDLVRNGSSGHIEWKPGILLRLARGRLARGEGDAEKLAMIAKATELLVEQARKCLEDDHEMLAWKRELAERCGPRHVG